MLDTTKQYVNDAGEPFQQLYQKLPALAPLYTQWESDFTPQKWVSFCSEHWEIPVLALSGYLLFITLGKKMLASQPALKLQGPLILWNLFLSIFSLMGAIRTVPHLLHNISTKSLEDTICSQSNIDWGAGATGLWVGLFIFSKLPELVDTIFIVLRQKPLIFLHWYHHVTVLLYCWHAYATEAGSGLYFVAMNYSVHAVMYGYYALSAMKMVPKWFPAYIITLGQIAQMIVGTFICGASWYYVTQTDRPCENKFENLVAGGLMYGSYLYLFVDFAVRRFIFKKPRGKKQNKVEAGQENVVKASIKQE